MDEIGLKVLEHSNMLKPVSLALLKDEDPSVACQAIVSGMKFFDSILQDLVQQVIISLPTILLILKTEKICN